MKKNICMGLLLCMVLSGCALRDSADHGTSYNAPDISREEYIHESKEAQRMELEDLIAEAELFAREMGDYMPASKRQETQEVMRRKSALQEKIRAFEEAYPDVELDRTLPDTEISESAFTWIRAAKEELGKGQSGSGKQENDLDPDDFPHEADTDEETLPKTE